MSITKEELGYLNQQEDILEKIINKINLFPKKERIGRDDILAFIEELKEEIKVGKEEDVPALYYQMNLQYNLLEKFTGPIELPDTRNPYFAHMEMELDQVKGRVKRHVFLGHVGFNDAELGVRIIDWKLAPLAQVFYLYEDGEEFEVDVMEKTISGKLLSSSILTVVNGKVQRVDKGKNIYLKKDESWVFLKEALNRFSGGQGEAGKVSTFGTGMTQFVAPDVVSLLDDHQQKILSKGIDRPLLVIGGAGSGKTTVSLFRLAKIKSNYKFDPKKILVGVSGEGLLRLTKNMLAKIGLPAVKVMAYNKLFEANAKRLFPKLKLRINQYTPFEVSLIKRSYALLELLENYAHQFHEELKQRVKKSLQSEEINSFIDQGKFFNSFDLLFKVNKNFNLTVVQKIHYEKERARLYDIRSDLLEIYLNKNELKRVFENSDQVSQNMIQKFVEYTNYQLNQVSDLGQNEKTLDGKGVDEGTYLEVGGTMDNEDFSLSLYLLKLKTGRCQTPWGKIPSYAHIVLDEAQELSPVELKVISELLPNKNSLTIAGDSSQQIDPSHKFNSWKEITHHLGVKETHSEELTVSYRSPQKIVNFAHKVLGPIAPKNIPKAKVEGHDVMITASQHRAHASLIIRKELEELVVNEPKATIAVICSSWTEAGEFYDELREIGPVRKVTEDEFSFKPGIDITTIESIRGLEFDYVILPHVDDQNYPINPRSRRRLYLAATRAIHQLWIIHPPNKSLLL